MPFGGGAEKAEPTGKWRQGSGKKKKTLCFRRFFASILLINVKKNVIINGYKREVKTLKENNEKEKTEKDKKKESGIITRRKRGRGRRPVFGARIFYSVHAVFDFRRNRHCGQFLPSRIVRLSRLPDSRRGDLSVRDFLYRQTLCPQQKSRRNDHCRFCLRDSHRAYGLTYSWNLSGYISRCFKEAAAGNTASTAVRPRAGQGRCSSILS